MQSRPRIVARQGPPRRGGTSVVWCVYSDVKNISGQEIAVVKASMFLFIQAQSKSDTRTARWA